MKSLVITVEASRDLSAISDYFLEQSVDAGDRFVEAFGKKCQHLAQFPYLGRSYSQFTPGLRGVPLMSYIIFYQIVENEDKIEILRVISGYRNLKNIFTRRLNGRSAIAKRVELTADRVFPIPRYTRSPGIEAV
ncbi:type II toxin-antitoxin system RelE/ParE family toxin [Coleofasciculus sp.]|uniref:type II toxin-antitoxin system RelE/ParE family toxin n=1 Tax=Coleofasciculus sp. TaxID=3100458 RepID=UPI0039F828E9